MRPYDRLKFDTRSAQQYLFAAPILEDVALGRFDVDTYVRFLTNAYHHVRHTVPLLMACGARLPDRLGWMRGRLKEYIDEEYGHENWILDDLDACGVDASAIAQSTPDLPVELLVSYVYDYINRRNPVGMLGMVHVLEGTSTRLASGNRAARSGQTEPAGSGVPIPAQPRRARPRTRRFFRNAGERADRAAGRRRDDPRRRSRVSPLRRRDTCRARGGFAQCGLTASFAY